MARQEDPFTDLAKKLCEAAGQNPNTRVPMEGSTRTMPAWCLFKDKAREQMVAKPETQDPRFANAPLRVFGEHEGKTIEQIRRCMTIGNVTGAVLCADGHLGYAQPVGGVVAYEDQISVSGVGFDIACGNMAVQLDVTLGQIEHRLPDIMQEIARTISFGVGRTNGEKVQHGLFDDSEAWRKSGMLDFRDKARQQLGTVGSGNHYVDVFVDVTNMGDPEFGGAIQSYPVWIGVHFGSRGLGHTAATRYLKLAGGKDGIDVPPTVLNVHSDLGDRYLTAMGLAGRYAYAGREWVVDRVRRIIGSQVGVTKTVHNHHNYAWREMHDGRTVFVVRKGATPAFPGQEGFIGGSMGDNAVIIEGVDSEASAASLYSTVHGSGRVFGRKEAKRRFTREEMDAWLREQKVLVAGGDLDESPMAYRRLPDVLAQHRGTILVKHTLKPLIVVMAGSGEFDPYKD